MNRRADIWPNKNNQPMHSIPTPPSAAHSDGSRSGSCRKSPLRAQGLLHSNGRTPVCARKQPNTVVYHRWDWLYYRGDPLPYPLPASHIQENPPPRDNNRTMCLPNSFQHGKIFAESSFHDQGVSASMAWVTQR